MHSMLLTSDKDPMGAAIIDYLAHGKASKLRVFSSMFDEDEIPVNQLFRTFQEMPSLEQKALQLSTGKILDVGAGSGCHTLALQEMGKEVTAIDISPLSVEAMNKRGVKDARLQNFFDRSLTGPFDTILLLMNGSGIIGKLENLPAFFHRLKEVLARDGQLLLDSSDLSYLFEDEDGNLDIAPEVAEALAAGKPVVALESTIISHGMPYPQNVETALKVEQIIRDAGAVPATIAIIGGRLKAGLSKEEIDYLGRTGAGIPKASRRDLPVLVAQGKDGACTVTTTMMIADMAGIRVFATGGIGGVHRGAQETFDISADLEELANTSVMVVCAGAKSILDLGLTLEYLETHGVTVIGYGTSELPAFYTRKSGFGVDYELDTPEQLAKAFHVKRELGLRGGLLVTNPIPEEYSMDKEVIDKAIAEAVEDAKKDGIHGKATTPYLLAKIKDLTGGDSLDSNIQLVFNNARLGAAAAVELSKLEK